MKILITGAAGFIGYHLVNKLVHSNHDIIGLDNINSYYTIELKHDRLSLCGIDKKELTNFDYLCLNYAIIFS